MNNYVRDTEGLQHLFLFSILPSLLFIFHYKRKWLFFQISYKLRLHIDLIYCCFWKNIDFHIFIIMWLNSIICFLCLLCTQFSQCSPRRPSPFTFKRVANYIIVIFHYPVICSVHMFMIWHISFISLTYCLFSFRRIWSIGWFGWFPISNLIKKIEFIVFLAAAIAARIDCQPVCLSPQIDGHICVLYRWRIKDFHW